MGPKSPFLPLFFVNYWKFFQKIFFAFSPLFRQELLRKSRVSEIKCTRFRVFLMRFLHIFRPENTLPESNFPQQCS